MKRLDLDFYPDRGRRRWPGIVLLALAALALAKLVDVRHGAQAQAEHLEARIAQLERRAAGVADAREPLPEATLLEIRQANAVIEQIALPWERLFRAVEAAASNKVALLGITPDPGGGTVEVSGECADLQTMFDYVKRLEGQPSLGRVYLLNHQVSTQDPQRPVRFTVTASWMPPAPRS